MFFNYTGYGNCYRGISVDPRFRQGDRPDDNNCGDNHPDRDRRDNNGCGDRHGGDRCDNNGCNDRRGGDRSYNNGCGNRRGGNRCDNNGCNDRRGGDCCDNNDCCDDHTKGSCHDDCPVDKKHCDNGDCCTEGVMAVLSIAMRTLGRDDTIDVEITLSGGYTQVVTLGRGTSTLISSDILRTPQGAVSLCEITRIRLLSSSVSDPEYMQRLQDELARFIGSSMRRPPAHGHFDGDCDSCVEAMQRYIMRNSDDIEALLFDGSQSVTASVVTGTVTTPVLTSAVIDTEPASFVSTAELTTDTVEAVTAVTAAETEVVTAVELLPVSLVSAVNETTASVSAPVIVTEVDVAGSIDITAAAEFASEVSVTDTTAITAVTTETIEAVSGFAAPTTVTGVLTGLTTAFTATAVAANIPIFSSGGSGALQVVIPAGAFGTNIPPADVTLPITVDGVGISYGGTDTIYAFADATTLLGATGTPAVSDIELLGTPTTTEVVSAVTTTEATVAGEVTFETVSGSLVTAVTPVTVGSADQPETVEAVTAITAEFSDINAVGTVSTAEAASLFTAETAAVLSDAQLDVTAAEAIGSAELTITMASAVSGITTEPVSVASPTFAEPIEGDIIGARRGIIAVDNTDGDISVYSSCAVRGAQLDTVPQP